jgi:hypothetical protein
MGIFGWSYPPGCSGPPEEAEPPCPRCGESPYRCACAPCGECGDAGCLTHLNTETLARELEALDSRAAEYRWELQRRGVNPLTYEAA